MLKKLMITTALSGVLIGAAYAEGTPPAPKPADPAAKSTEMNKSSTPATSTEMNKSTTPSSTTPPKSTEMNKPADKSTTAAAPTDASKSASSAKFINSQKSDQFLASSFKGTDVVGPDDKKIGDISDILFDKNGKIEAYVVSVGGFLGIGSKHVALEPSAFQIVSGDKSKNENDKIKVALDKEQLTQAANFEPYKAPQQTTGMGTRPAGGSRPAPAGAR
jgi:hypothetical protein